MTTNACLSAFLFFISPFEISAEFFDFTIPFLLRSLFWLHVT